MRDAAAFTKQLVEGKDVRLEFDVQRKDKYRRTLAYIYAGDMMLNAELVRQGYAPVADCGKRNGATLGVQYTQNWQAHAQHSQPSIRRGVRQ